MIASVRGTVGPLGPDGVVIVVGGVGLLVQCTPGTLARLRPGEEAELSTSLVVREQELTLYGFADADEREVFEALQTAAGVGPRLAQAVLAVHSPDAVRRAVATEDLAALTLVPGIGKKGAQRIVLDLRDRLGPPSGSVAPAPTAAAAAGPPPWEEQVRAGLGTLGYTGKEADTAVLELTGTHPGEVEAGDVSALLRLALAVLRRG